MIDNPEQEDKLIKQMENSYYPFPYAYVADGKLLIIHSSGNTTEQPIAILNKSIDDYFFSINGFIYDT